MTLFVQIVLVDEFKGQICHDYPNCVISSLQLPDRIRWVPRPESHGRSETATGDSRTHPQSSIELPTRELCCSSCGKAGVGSCSNRRTTGVSSSESKKLSVKSGGEREESDQAQSSEGAAEGLRNVSASKAEDAANEKRSDGDEAEGDVSSKFSNKDDVIAQGGRLGTNEERKCDDHTNGGGGVLKDMVVQDDGDTTRTDVNPSVLLQGSSAVETDTKVRKSVTVRIITMRYD